MDEKLEEEEVVEGMNVHLSEDKEVISVRSQQLSIEAIMRLSTMDTRQRTVASHHLASILHLAYM